MGKEKDALEIVTSYKPVVFKDPTRTKSGNEISDKDARRFLEKMIGQTKSDSKKK